MVAPPLAGAPPVVVPLPEVEVGAGSRSTCQRSTRNGSRRMSSSSLRTSADRCGARSGSRRRRAHRRVGCLPRGRPCARRGAWASGHLRRGLLRVARRGMQATCGDAEFASTCSSSPARMRLLVDTSVLVGGPLQGHAANATDSEVPIRRHARVRHVRAVGASADGPFEMLAELGELLADSNHRLADRARDRGARSLRRITGAPPPAA